MAAPATTSPSAHPAPGDGALELLGRAVLAAGVLGLVLGLWCRSFADGTGGPLGSAFADFGAPWILVAFAAGAAVAVHRPGEAVLEAAGVVLGGLTGAGAMVLASFAYYGETSSWSALYWAGVGVVVGVVAGVAGAVWRAWPGTPVAALATTGLGLTFAAEGVARLGGSWWLAYGPSARQGALLIIAGGAALPALLGRGRPAGWIGSAAVLALAVPASAVVVSLSTVPSALI